MKLNETTCVIGKNVSLVPYNEEHVPKYHSWMVRKELRDATASEQLTLDEEYAMQKSWREDETKCTFIVMNGSPSTGEDAVERMLGDVNLFLFGKVGELRIMVAEVSVMIADESNRKRGIGYEALCLMLYYGKKYLNVFKFIAKIGFANTASEKLFEKAGFKLVSRNEVFQEAMYTVDADDAWSAWLEKETADVKVLP